MLRTAFGGCCQWVLDAVRETVEWLLQPLGFNFLALLWSLDKGRIYLTPPGSELFYKCFADDVWYQFSGPG